MSNETKKPKVSIIAAISSGKKALGYKNKLLWKINGDLPRFKSLTTGHPIIMGRLTYESIGRPLPDRTNIVVSKSNTISETKDLIIVNSIEEALKIAGEKDTEEVFVIGGGKIYSETIDFADRLYLTLVHDEPEADTFFPDYSEFKTEISREKHGEHVPSFEYVVLEK